MPAYQARYRKGGRDKRAPFALVAILLVIAVVAVVLGIFFLVRRWL